MAEKRRSGVYSILGIKRWQMRQKDTQLCFFKTTLPEAFIAKMDLQRFHRHPGGAKRRVHLLPTDAYSGLQSWCHLCPDQYLPQPVTLSEFNIRILLICQPYMRIHKYLFPVLNLSLWMHVPSIASMIHILIKICWLMKEYPLVSTLSAVWYCSKHSCWRPEQPIEQTWQWWLALIEWHDILEILITLN